MDDILLYIFTEGEITGLTADYVYLKIEQGEC